MSRASLAFLGTEDVYLTADPEITYFVEKYKGQTLYSSRVIRIQFPGNNKVTYDSDSSLLIPKLGDLITNMYLKIIPPYLGAGINVLDSAGTLMIKYIELYIGSELIERIYGEYIEMKLDIEIPAGKQQALHGLVGKYLIPTPSVATSYTIPIPFSIMQRGLPTCAFQEDITVRVVWNSSVAFTSPATNITTNFSAFIDTEYTYLGDKEIEYINSTPKTYLIEQVQRIDFFAPVGINTVMCSTNFVNPVKELFWVFQNDSAVGYDYTTNGSYLSNGTTYQQLSSLVLNFNTVERISADVGTGTFLGLIQPLEFHTKIPSRIFYMYSFSLDPENSLNPTGSVNLSRIKNQTFKFTLNSSSSNRNIRIYAISYNIIYIANNHANMLFSTFQ
jgi:hypothetical protein